MVWAAIGVGFRHLVIIPQGMKVTSEQYRRRCLQGTLVEHLLSSGHFFMQDGAGCHKGCREYLRGKGVKLIENFPARSPDLNPIETLWAIMQRRVSLYGANNRSELVTAIQQVWAELDQKTIDELVLSYPKRCASVVKNGGIM